MNSLLVGQSRKDRVRRVFRRLAFVVGGVLLCLLLSYTAFRRWTLMTPPEDAGDPLPQQVEVVTSQTGSPRTTVGPSWMEWRDGMWQMELAGDPRVMGHSHALLAARITRDIEHHMERLTRSYVPSFWRRWLVGNAVRWKFRHLPENIPPLRLVELAAYSRAVVQTESFDEQPFQRLVYYHSLHDMTQRLAGSPLIGCTAFAVWGSQSTNGHLLVGRNFDFEGGEIFDRQKAVMVFRTPDRIPFVSVAWPGMMGVVTGVNAHKIYVSMNAARTDDDMQPGIPMAFLLREILEQAHTIEEALEVIKKHPVMVAEAILVADGKKPDAAVVELSPKQLAVRRGGNGLLGVTNHFRERRFKKDANNDWLRRYTTSQARYQRLEQLLRRFRGRIDVPTAAMILRNRTGVDDAPLGLGNRNALDALIATHGVVVDLTQMVLWVSRGPHLLGGFSPIDLKPIFGLEPSGEESTTPEPIAQDPLLDSPRLEAFRIAQKQLELSEELGRKQNLQRATDFARRATLTQPDSAEAHKALADLLWQTHQIEAAQKAYRRFLELSPPYLADREEAKVRAGR